jgi:LysM repeat protein
MSIKVKRWLPLIVLVLCLVVPASPTLAASGTIHVVRAGETLADIAYRYGTTATALARANGLRNPNFIWWGQRLVIPGRSSAPAATSGSVHVVRYGETLAKIAARYGTSVWALARANGLSNINHIYVGQRLRVSGSGSSYTPPSTGSSGSVHVVRYGETLAKIAARYGTSVWALARANGLSNINHIYVGQRLRISGSGSAPASTPSTGGTTSGGKWIDINLSRQRLTAYVGNTAVWSSLISGGLPGMPTPAGRYAIQYKVSSTTMSGPGYYLTGVPWVMGFVGAYSIHGAYWHNNFGQPMSHGCVNLPVGNAAWLYSWSYVGLPVVVHW